MIASSSLVDLVPYAIPINDDVLKIESKTALTSPQIVFIGRQEIRKGVIELADAIPLVLKKHPSTHFTFVGGSAGSPKKGIDMISYLKEKLQKHIESVTFTGRVDHKKVAFYLDLGDIFVFPSHYESFGLVCTEAMAAGKAVIGSENGGMVEILKNGECGLLTFSNSDKIADNILKLIEDNNLRIALGKKARERIIQDYSFEAIIPRQIESYLNAISISQTLK